jgi:hypothetical protein
MCRSIHTLRRTGTPATDEEIRTTALQSLRKVSGYRKPSRANSAAFEAAVDEIARALHAMLHALEAHSHERAESAAV